MAKLHPILHKALNLAQRHERVDKRHDALKAKLEAQLEALDNQRTTLYHQVNETLARLNDLGIDWAFHDIRDYLYHDEGDVDGYVKELAECQPENALAILA